MISGEAPRVVATPGSLSVFWKGRFLYSERDPSRLPCRIAEACDKGPSRLHLVFSPLLWYGLPELLKNIGEGSAVLCIEAEAELAQLTRDAMPQSIRDDLRVRFIATDSIKEVVATAKSMGPFRAVAPLSISGGAGLNDRIYSDMRRFLAAEIESDWRNRAAFLIMGRLWAKNIISNISALPDILPRALPRVGRPILLCGAGPSLEVVLPLAKRQRTRIYVISCDTAAGTLKAAGIDPDLIICLEAQAYNLQDFTALGGQALDLMGDLSSHPATFRTLSGKKHLSLVRIAESAFLDRVSRFLSDTGIAYSEMQPLGSVGVHALSVASTMTSSPLIVSGLDFSFERGKTHARGTPGLLGEERKLRRLYRWRSQFAASLGERCTPILDSGSPGFPSLFSDPVLSSYASLTATLPLAGSNTLYDIRGRGPSIGGRRISLDEADSILESFSARSSAPDAKSSSQSVSPDARLLASAASGFLTSELSLLEDLDCALRGSASKDSQELIRLVAECDYVYWSFPDAARAVRPGQDFLNRLVPELAFWGWRLRSALEGLQNRSRSHEIL